MGENRSEILSASQNGQVRSMDVVVQAKRKRMMLAEVYVHKSRKLDTDAKKDDHFEVFHIYEFDDNDSNTKITPKLSTNCTEPRKIIEVLQNSTGSDTPQLQRLIEKLCAQNKKWTENQTNKTGTSNAAANGINGNKATQGESNAHPTVPTVTNASAAAVTPVTVAAPPVIRVKAIESMKQASPTIAANPPKILNTPKLTNPTALTVISQPPSTHRLPTLRPSEIAKNGSEPEKVSVAGNKKTSDNNPVKLWNNVIQKNSTRNDLDYLVVANPEETHTDESVFCLKATKEVIEHATENSSALKIDQVYESVSDEFVEDLLVEKRPTSASPLLDTLVKEVVDNHNQPVAAKNGAVQIKKLANPLTFIPSTNNKCTDFRCNICLAFNETIDEFKTHMCYQHHCNFICEKCHDSFRTHQLYDLHLSPITKECVNPENAKRTFICIVDPPVILMKSNKVFAFRCKYCSVAFHNQRNYVQHAQRHAKLFRCKLCPQAKTMSATSMQHHLSKH